MIKNLFYSIEIAIKQDNILIKDQTIKSSLKKTR